MYLTQCEYASAHPDGTITLVRTGIERWPVTAAPQPFQFYVYAEAAANELPEGEHVLNIRVVSPDGRSDWFALEARVRVPPEGTTRIVMPVGGIVRGTGRATVEVSVAGVSVRRVLEFHPVVEGADGGRAS
jgi:hypothetical protein